MTTTPEALQAAEDAWSALNRGDATETLTSDQVASGRRLRGWTQADLARVLGLTRVVVSRWELGQRRLSRRDSLAIRFAVLYADLAQTK